MRYLKGETKLFLISMAGTGNGGGEIFNSNNARPSYEEIGYKFMRSVKDLNLKGDAIEELKKELRVLKAGGPSNKEKIKSLKGTIRMGDEMLEEMLDEVKRKRKQLKIEVEFAVEKAHKYGFFDCPPGMKKIIKGLGFLELALGSAITGMSVFGEEIAKAVSFPTNSEIYAVLGIGFAMNGFAYLMMKFSESLSDRLETSVKSKTRQILAKYGA